MKIEQALEGKYAIYAYLNDRQASVNDNGVLVWTIQGGPSVPVALVDILSNSWETEITKTKIKGWIGFFKNDACGIFISPILDSKEKAEKYYHPNQLIGTTYINEEFSS